MNRNVKVIELDCDSTGIKHFQKTPAFNKLLTKDQIISLAECDGLIEVKVNHYQYSALIRMCNAIKEHAKVTDITHYYESIIA